MQSKVQEVHNLDGDTTFIFNEFYEMGRRAAEKAWEA